MKNIEFTHNYNVANKDQIENKIIERQQKLFLLEKRTEREKERLENAYKEHEGEIAKLNKDLKWANNCYNLELKRIEEEKQEILKKIKEV